MTTNRTNSNPLDHSSTFVSIQIISYFCPLCKGFFKKSEKSFSTALQSYHKIPSQLLFPYSTPSQLLFTPTVKHFSFLQCSKIRTQTNLVDFLQKPLLKTARTWFYHTTTTKFHHHDSVFLHFLEISNSQTFSSLLSQVKIDRISPHTLSSLKQGNLYFHPIDKSSFYCYNRVKSIFIKVRATLRHCSVPMFRKNQWCGSA